MSDEKHIVLGGAGAIGRAVIDELIKRNKSVISVERSYESSTVQILTADLLDSASVEKVIEGATHVYVCVGLPYKAEVWQRDWPRLMCNIISACEKHNAKIIFFDNMYMYSHPLPIPFDETTAQHPSSKKGKARKIAAQMLVDAHRQRRVRAVIGRSADFYGPYAVNSRFYIRYLENILSGKNPQFIGSRSAVHTYAYTGDNGRALVELALDDSAYGEVWHLPVGEAKTPEQMKAILERVIGKKLKVSYMPIMMSSILSVFLPLLTEVADVRYQFDQDYVMSDAKFREKYPDFKVTAYEDGFKSMVESFTKNG